MQKLDKFVAFKLSKVDAEKLKKEAEALRVSVSDLIRFKIFSKDKEG